VTEPVDVVREHGSLWSTPQSKRRSRRGHGPHPKPNVVPIPHRLAHLPVDRFGYPIPWVSDWTETKNGPFEYRPVDRYPHLGDYDASEYGIGEGHPLPGNLHPGRQVRAMALGLCGVCGRGITGRYVFIGAASLVQSGFREPPVHRECAAYAVAACPGINNGRSVVAEARDYERAPLYSDGERTYTEQSLLRRLPVVYLLGMIRHSDGAVWTMRAWAQRAKACPHPHLTDGFPAYDLGDPSTYPDVTDPLGDSEEGTSSDA